MPTGTSDSLAMASSMEIVFINHDELLYIHGRLCIVVGLLVMYTEWMKLLFTMWVTFHLFCFAVLHKNLKKLEVLYIVTSLLVPALIAADNPHLRDEPCRWQCMLHLCQYKCCIQ